MILTAGFSAARLAASVTMHRKILSIMLPVMNSYGFSTLQFGAMMITGLAIGLVTPPVGMCLNACNKINRMPIIDIFKGALPYVICNIIVLVAISVFPALTTALPIAMGYTP